MNDAPLVVSSPVGSGAREPGGAPEDGSRALSGASLDASPSHYGRRQLLLLALMVAVLITALYGRTLQYGWHWDDYHQVRAYTPREVAAAFHGPWDPGGPEASFFRPLTIAWFALRFQLFGYWAPAYHAVSLLLLGLCALLTAPLAAQLTGSRSAGVGAACLLLLHPVTPESLAVWAANQPHLFALLIALIGANWVVRREPATYAQWLPGLAAVCLSLGFKEDGLALLFWLPALLAAKLRRWPSATFVAAVLFTALVLVLGRGLLLGELGGYTAKRLSVEQLIGHVLRGPASVLALGAGDHRQLLQLGFAPGDRTVLQATATLAEYVAHYGAIALLAVGALKARRSPALAAGLSAIAFFNAPLIWQSKATGWHHLLLAATLVFAAVGLATTRELLQANARILSWAYLAGFGALLVPINIVATDAYGPCSAAVRARDGGTDIEAWTTRGLVSEEMRMQLEKKRAACSTP